MTSDESIQLAHRWLNAPIEQHLKDEILAYLDKIPEEIMERFSSNLTFGTSGFRALTGVGSNRLNPVTIRAISQAVAQYMQDHHLKKAIICYDHRKDSFVFAMWTARVLAANNLFVNVMQELRPVPYLSFAIRHLHYDLGIMITASHNPKEYNGYKIYGKDGGELIPDEEHHILKALSSLDPLYGCSFTEEQDPKIHLLDLQEPDRAYLNLVQHLLTSKEATQQHGHKLNLIYSSLHGAGITLTPKALNLCGFTSLALVDKQCKIDPNFSTVVNPNPEHPETLALGIEMLLQKGADLLLVNDGDANRLGAVALHEGKPYIFNGNELALLAAYHLCHDQHSHLPKNGAMIISLVTTPLIKKLAHHYHLTCFEVDVGFKYIARQIHQWDLENHPYTFVFGAEESYGFLVTDKLRDKDGVAAACFLSELALASKIQGLTLVDVLHALYQTHGLFREWQHSLVFPKTCTGYEKKEQLLTTLRNLDITHIGKFQVHVLEDHLLGIAKTGKFQKKFHGLSSNILTYHLDHNCSLIIRPSGTEPKLRLYLRIHIPSFSSLDEGVQHAEIILHELKDSVVNFLERL